MAGPIVRQLSRLRRVIDVYVMQHPSQQQINAVHALYGRLRGFGCAAGRGVPPSPPRCRMPSPPRCRMPLLFAIPIDDLIQKLEQHELDHARWASESERVVVTPSHGWRDTAMWQDSATRTPLG